MTRDDSEDATREQAPNRSRDHAAQSDSGLTRRDSLKLGGTALAGSVAGLGAAGTAAAAENTITLDPGESRTIDVTERQNNTFENTLVDASADGAEFSIQAVGDDWTIRNVGIKGPISSSVSHVIRLRVTDPDGVGTIDNVYIEDAYHNIMFKCYSEQNSAKQLRSWLYDSEV